MPSRSLDELVPGCAERARHLIARAEIAGIGLLVTSTLRTWDEQDALFAQGRTRPGKRVTDARGGQSWHNFGRALDVAFMVGGRVTWDGPWQTVGVIGEAIGLEWGGRFPKPDRPHFQWRAGLTLAAARARDPRRLRL